MQSLIKSVLRNLREQAAIQKSLVRVKIHDQIFSFLSHIETKLVANSLGNTLDDRLLVLDRLQVDLDDAAVDFGMVPFVQGHDGLVDDRVLADTHRSLHVHDALALVADLLYDRVDLRGALEQVKSIFVRPVGGSDARRSVDDLGPALGHTCRVEHGCVDVFLLAE